MISDHRGLKTEQENQNPPSVQNAMYDTCWELFINKVHSFLFTYIYAPSNISSLMETTSTVEHVGIKQESTFLEVHLTSLMMTCHCPDLCVLLSLTVHTHCSHKTRFQLPFMFPDESETERCDNKLTSLFFIVIIIYLLKNKIVHFSLNPRSSHKMKTSDQTQKTTTTKMSL